MSESPNSFANSSASAALCDMPEWLPCSVSDWRLRGLRDRHYAGGVGGKTVGQPGKRIAFVTFEGTAGWVSHWPKPEFIDHEFGEAFVCTLFRKECPGRASVMIEDAIARTETRWGAPPDGGWLTFVDPDEVESPNPGYCFKMAGFEPVGFTKDRGLLVLRRVQDATQRTEGGDEAHRTCVTGESPAALEADGVRASHPPISDGARTIRLASDPRVRHVRTTAVAGVQSSARYGRSGRPELRPRRPEGRMTDFVTRDERSLSRPSSSPNSLTFWRGL